MLVLDGTCAICGSPCYNWGDRYRLACVKCATKVEQKRSPDQDTKYLIEYYEKHGGEGFSLSNAFFDMVKSEYQNSKMNDYFDCRTSAASLCKGKKEHDPSTVKEYLVDYPGEGNKKVCLCQHHYDNRVKFGWHPSSKWKTLDGKEIDKNIELSTLKTGQRVQVELLKTGKVVWATVVEGRDAGAPLIYFDEPQKEGSYDSWKAYTDDRTKVENLGLDGSKPNCWFAYKDQIKVLQVKENVSGLKPSSFKAGQRIQVEHMGHKSWATVVIAKGSCKYGLAETLVYFDDEMSKPGASSWVADSSYGADTATIKQIAITLGLDVKQKKFRYITDTDSKILDVSTDSIALGDLKEGDRVYVHIYNEIYTWATVVREGNNPVLYLDEPISKNKVGGLSWENSGHDETAVKYGLVKGAKNYWTAHSRDVAIVAKGKSLTKIDEIKEKEDNMSEPQQYKVGEELKVSIFGKEYLATVVQEGKKGTNSYGYNGTTGSAVIYLPPRNGVGWSADSSSLRKTIKDRGLGNGYANNCYHLNGDVKIIKRLNEETNKKGEEDMGKKVNKYKVGDRIKIHADSSYPFTGWATVISLKGFEGDADQPLLFMDEEQDDTWPWEEEWQRKAAIKAGLDPERACFWWLGSDDTTVLETEEKVEESKKLTTMMKNDMVDAGYRVAGHQMTKGVKAGLLKLFKDKGADDSKLRIVEELLDSEVGSSMIALMLGYGLAYIPNISEDPRIQKLSKEFRVGGMSTAGNMIMDTAIEYLAPAVLGAVDKLPPIGTMATAAVEKSGIKKKGKKRVAAAVRVKEEAKAVEPEVEEETSKKVAVSA